MSPDVTIHIIDDDLDVCRSLALLLQTEGFAVKPYLSATQLLAEAEHAEAGMVISDICMPEIDGVTFVQRWREAGRSDPVVLVTGHADVPLAVRALRAGAFNFIEKPFTHAIMIAAVKDALHAPRARQSSEHEHGQEVIKSLSKREREVLSALVDGNTSKSIASNLGISPRTVEIHRANLMEKTGARNLSRLVRIGIEAGMGSG